MMASRRAGSILKRAPADEDAFTIWLAVSLSTLNLRRIYLAYAFCLSTTDGACGAAPAAFMGDGAGGPTKSVVAGKSFSGAGDSIPQPPSAQRAAMDKTRRTVRAVSMDPPLRRAAGCSRLVVHRGEARHCFIETLCASIEDGHGKLKRRCGGVPTISRYAPPMQDCRHLRRASNRPFWRRCRCRFRQIHALQVVVSVATSCVSRPVPAVVEYPAQTSIMSAQHFETDKRRHAHGSETADGSSDSSGPRLHRARGHLRREQEQR